MTGINRPAVTLALSKWILLLSAVASPSLVSAVTIPTPSIMPSSVPLNKLTDVTFTVAISDSSLIPASVNLQKQDSSGLNFSNVGTMYDDGTHGDVKAADGTFTLKLNLTEAAPYPVNYRVSAGFKGSLTRVFSNLAPLSVSGSAPAVVKFASPANLSFFNSSPVTVTGTVSDPAATVTINGINASVSGGSFTVPVPLQEGNNTITATAKTAQGSVSTASLQVTLDTLPPRVSIDSPYDSYSTTDSSITVTGKANDTVVGTVSDQQVQVTVNGVGAQVANRGFRAVSIPLTLGNNTISATAHDHAGNGATASIVVHRIAATQSHINVVSGNNQSAGVGSALGSPLVASLTDGSGAPVSGVAVVFSVTQNNGLLQGGKQTVAVNTGSDGQASTTWTIGSRSGSGNNIVEATASGFAGSAIFSASGLSGNPAQINVDAGSQQLGAVGQPLPHPFVVAVTDAAHNRLAAAHVTFKVMQGGGGFGGQVSLDATTDSDGRALAILTLGPNEGIANNVVEATFQGNAGFPAAFSATGKVPGNPSATRIVGVVLDNSNNPVQGATIRAFVNSVPLQQSVGLPQNVTAVSDAQGQFVIQPAPVGYVKIIADGSTVKRPGKWPNLEYELVTVSGQTNTIGLPIYLLPLDQNHQLCVSNSQGGTLTLPDIPGFSLSVLAGAATFPGGSKTGCLTVTSVHPDKIPMVPGFGQQPRFIVTIQPAGTLFSPPAAISIPNSDGLKAREVTEMYSFDHDLNTFVSVGTATVSDDATVIRSDPGVGVLKAGWYCGGPPTPAGSVGVCGECKKCNGSSCEKDSLQDGNVCVAPGGGPGICSDGQGNCIGFDGVLTPQDNFNGRSKSIFGIAEVINLSFMSTASAAAFGGLQWRIVSGGGTLTGGADGTGTYTASGNPGQVVLRLEVASGPSQGKGHNYSISVVAPSSAHLTQFGGIYHLNGFASVGFRGHIFLAPTNVSFSNLVFAEGTAVAVASGYYLPQNGNVHMPTAIPLSIGGCNITTGCTAVGMDTVQAAPGRPPFSAGEYLWPIPWQYQAPGGTLKQFYIANHHKYCDAAGTTSIEKATAGPFTKKVSDPTSGY